MKIYFPYYENHTWHIATLNSLECTLYKHKLDNGYTILLITMLLHIMLIMSTVMN